MKLARVDQARRFRIGIAGALALLIGSQSVVAGELRNGPAQVIDGDGLYVDAREIRLWGIDAPEWDQTCQDAAGRPWPCGQEAEAFLRSIVAGAELACVERDRHGKRLVATCQIRGQDLGALIVRAGWAMDWDSSLSRAGEDCDAKDRCYSGRHYAEAEAEAIAEKRGAWRGGEAGFVPPSAWRKRGKHGSER